MCFFCLCLSLSFSILLCYSLSPSLSLYLSLSLSPSMYFTVFLSLLRFDLNPFCNYEGRCLFIQLFQMDIELLWCLASMLGFLIDKLWIDFTWRFWLVSSFQRTFCYFCLGDPISGLPSLRKRTLLWSSFKALISCSPLGILRSLQVLWTVASVLAVIQALERHLGRTRFFRSTNGLQDLCSVEGPFKSAGWILQILFSLRTEKSRFVHAVVRKN